VQRIYGWGRILETGAPAFSCSVTVYDTGTLNLATIFADNLSTPKANPFTADASSAYWFFYAASTGRYDVQFSGGGITTPYTIGDISTSGLLSLNGLSADAQLFATGSAGNDFGIVSAVATHTFNIPSASATARGLVTTAAQTFAGAKTFTTPIGVTSGGTGNAGPSANGQLLIGAAIGTYTLATLTGTANQVTVTNGAGSIILSLPQNIAAGSSPTFTGLTLSGLTANSFLFSGVGGLLTTTAAPTDGQILIGSTGAAPVAATLTAGTGITITNGPGSITVGTMGVISSINGLTAASQTFAVGTAGNDFGISSAGSIHTFDLPDASATARGVITTGVQTIAGAKTFTGALVNTSTTDASFSNHPKFEPGTSSGSFAPAVGRLSSNSTPVGNVGAGEDNLMTYALPANALATDGQTVRVTCWGTTAANANGKVVKAYFGATSVTLINGGLNAIPWFIQFFIVRTGAATQQLLGVYQSRNGGTADVQVLRATPAETLSNSITLKLTAEATADNDVVQQFMMVEVVG
jgi:hypothetical protein